MLPVGIGSSGIDTGDIANSLRWRRSASAYIATGKTTSATSTYFACFKQGALDAINPIFDGNIKINANNTITAFGLTTSAVKRDPTSHHWIHVSNNGLVFDGVNLGAVTTSSISSLRIGYDGTNYADMYGSRICCVSGSSVAYTSFVTFNSTINEWVVNSQSAIKALVDAGDASSFMYDFDDGSSTTTLGYDKSSKGNNATLNNFSLTAGTNYDWMLDVPGNSYAVLNSIYPSAANITNGNLSSGTTAARGTMNSTAFDSQWFVTAGGSAVTAGVIDDSGTTSTTSVTANKVFAFKMTTAGALSYKNVTDAGSWTSIATGLTGNRWPYSVTQAASWNFGQQPLPEALDSGFKALCQANMPDVPAAYLNPRKHADVDIYTGTGSSLSRTAFQFAADFLDIKSRSAATDWALYDSVRGVQKRLESNTTDAEVTSDNGVTSFDSTGFTLGTLAQVNTNTATYAALGIKAGGAGVSNTAGSITSTVSANEDIGFSIVSFKHTTAGNYTVGHGGKVNGVVTAPGFIFLFNRTTGGFDHDVYYPTQTGNNRLILNSTAAAGAGYWNGVTSTTFGILSTIGFNNNDDVVAYCFAPGFFSIGSYTGNGSADGPYVHTGHKSRWLLVKIADPSSAVFDWAIWDTARNTYNVMWNQLIANGSAAEYTADHSYDIDFSANGFKIRSAYSGINESGKTIIYISIPDVHAKYSLAR